MKKMLYILLILGISNLIFDTDAAKDLSGRILQDYLQHPEKHDIDLVDSSLDEDGGYDEFIKGGMTTFTGRLPNNHVLTIATFEHMPPLSSIVDENNETLPNLPRDEVSAYLLALVDQAKAKLRAQGKLRMVPAYPEAIKSKSSKAISSSTRSTTTARPPAIPGSAPIASAPSAPATSTSTATSSTAVGQPAIPGTGPDEAQ